MIVSALPIKALTDALRAGFDPAASPWPVGDLAVLGRVGAHRRRGRPPLLPVGAVPLTVPRSAQSGWELARTTPLRKTETGPSSLTAMTVAAGVVMAVAAGRGVTCPAERTDVPLGDVAGHESHTEVAEHALGVEHGRTVDLRERVTQRRELAGGADPQGRRGRESLLDGRAGIGRGSVDEQRADAQRSEIMDRELQEVFDDRRGRRARRR